MELKVLVTQKARGRSPCTFFLVLLPRSASKTKVIFFFLSDLTTTAQDGMALPHEYF